ncbi:cytochrome c oxidase accessory protein FixG [Stenotrophomonas maltophilia]|uniref:4Fe-4S dicluster domain-containing protein n=1 Tax=Stenotrophomonas chelatiphaga TaxID=517011 RepID=UPI000F4BF016|nr:4Fe-4S dicluster domain-containing protein [Stenotrophomonas chelatiphaga]MCS4230292.1 polyferredoxin [Stenotrophomonas chelatiphaga]ROQ43610.1 cytochrome c oxidase accessory protein FixG [Stenotrophomonas maltophilia]
MNRPALLSRIRTWLPVGLLVGFHALPWLRWDGRQAVLLDLVERRFDVFGLTLWPGQAGLLLGVMAVLATMLALFTNLAGRLWCGHACPQTVWSTLFSWVERGTRRLFGHSRAEPVARHALWIGIALWTALSFVGLFTPLQPLLARAAALRLGGFESFWVAFYAVATWGNAGFLRRHVCRLLCPFARLQPLLCDGHTPRMLYQAPRGEPRGPRQPGGGSIAQRGRGLLDAGTAQDYVFRWAHPQLAGPMPRFADDRLGDCTDCRHCVQACPMALDVRDGPQADCLDCGACAVACEQSQQAAGLGHGLIQHISPRRLGGDRPQWIRPRTLALSGLLSLVLGLVLLGAALAG